MTKPTWVFVAGPYRSGSTTQYQMTRNIVEETGNGLGVGRKSGVGVAVHSGGNGCGEGASLVTVGAGASVGVASSVTVPQAVSATARAAPPTTKLIDRTRVAFFMAMALPYRSM